MAVQLHCFIKKSLQYQKKISSSSVLNKTQYED